MYNARMNIRQWAVDLADLLQEEEARKELLSRIPLRRLSEVGDVLGAVVFLASPASDMATGHTPVIDGGWTAV